ncbi:MAG: DUF1326 domain-containing protein [Alphaproteobacteria bacterium]|nr:DUF1326 domain-containing protein [Alphaproteobacteria bacterium]
MSVTVDWRLGGALLSSCNCNWGCPCNFSGTPSYGDCRAALAVDISQGYFGDVRLDGLRFCGLYAWPGAVHDGGGRMQLCIDERANEAQRNALLAIATGQQTEPGATVFSAYRLTSDTLLEPLFRPIQIETDLASGTGAFSVPGLIDAHAEPIRHPKSGRLNRVRVQRAFGVEYRSAEFLSGHVTTNQSPIALNWSERHAHLAPMLMTPRGPADD